MNGIMQWLTSGSSASHAIVLLCKVTGLLIGAGMLATVMRQRSASARHFLWMLAIGGSLALAALAPVAPTVSLPVARMPLATSSAPVTISSGAGPSTVSIEDVARAASPATGVTTASDLGTPARPSALHLTASTLLAVWLTGVALLMGWFSIGHLVLARLVRRTTRLDDPSWQRALTDIARRFGITRHVRLARSASVRAPLTWGWRRPVIVVPDDAEGWPSERRDAVLMHEMAHVARRDYAAQCAANLTCAFYWFHPGVWVAARRLRSESELACDDRVIAAGTPGPEYAAHLLEVARGARELRLAGAVAVGMARRSHLEGRLLAVLDSDRARRGPSSSVMFGAAVGAAALLVPIAGLTPQVRAEEAHRIVTADTMVAPASLALVAPDTAALSAGIGETLYVRRTRPRGRDDARDSTLTIVRGGQTITVGSDDGDGRGIGRGEGRAVRRSDDGSAADSTFERTISARPGGTLTLDLKTGATVDIRGWSERSVRIRGRLAGPDWEDTQVDIDDQDDGARVRFEPRGNRRSWSTSHSLEIMVPRRFDVRIASAGGHVAVASLEGTVTGNSGGGGITLEQVSGRVELSTGGGDIQVRDVDADGRVSTGGGTVTLSGVRGGLRGSSGSGPVIYADETGQSSRDAELRRDTGSGRLREKPSDDAETRRSSGSVRSSGEPDRNEERGRRELADLGRVRVESNGSRIVGVESTRGVLHVQKAGGDIELASAPQGAVVTTGGGRVSIGRGAGSVSATTGGGDVTVGPIAGSVTAGTGAGVVRVTVADEGTDEQTVRVWSGSGRVIVTLPADFDGRFDVETAFTRSEDPVRITSDFDLRREPVSDWDDSQGTPRRYVRATGRTGSGRGLVHIRTVNGDVEIRRAGGSGRR